jgi:hypothetical protein
MMLWTQCRTWINMIPDVPIGPPRTFGDIDAGAECAVTRGAHNGGVDRIGVTNGLPNIGNALSGGLVERVHFVGAIEGNGGDMIVTDFKNHFFVRHLDLLTTFYGPQTTL